MLLYVWNYVERFPQGRADVESAPDLNALLASALATIMEQRLRCGLGRAYATRQRTVRGLRGRVMFIESARRQLFERGEAHCQFPEFTDDVPRNRIIKAVVRRLVSVGMAGPEADGSLNLRHRLRLISRALYHVADIEPTVEMIAREPLGRNDADYRVMLSICKLLLQRLMPTESPGDDASPTVARSEVPRLFGLFEQFVLRFYEYRLAEWRTFPQQTFYWPENLGVPEKAASPFLPIMRPDIVLRHRVTGRLIVLDTKFTKGSLLEGQYGGKRFDSSHLYQMYAYLRTQERRTDAHRCATGILLYPSVETELRERVVLQDHTLRVESVDLSRPWPDIEARLLELAS